MGEQEKERHFQKDCLSAKRKWVVIVSAIVVVAVVIAVFALKFTGRISPNNKVDLFSDSKQKLLEYYNETVRNYNVTAGDYRKIKGLASLKNASYLPDTGGFKAYLYGISGNSIPESVIAQDILQIQRETEGLENALTLAHSVFNQKIAKYNEAVNSYNAIADEYKKIREITSLENIAGLPGGESSKVNLDENIKVSDFVENGIFQDAMVQDTKQIKEETEELLYTLILAQQITNPGEKWVMDRLKSIDNITEMQPVTKNHDPNRRLNVAGGYTSCVYFSVSGIDQSSIRGTNVIDKGTDAGGAIEVYKTVTDAQNRCDYLGQFDNTLLYSGSYAIVGTMVIRTSYLLSNEQQLELTDKITAAFTTLK